MSDESLLQLIEEKQKALGSTGRVLVRASGTEALIRVMVEAADKTVSDEVALSLASYVEKLSKKIKNVN